jgi:hypothetical protein
MRRYEFHVVERLSATAAAAFPQLSVTDGSSGTALFGPVRDDAELHGVLSRLQLSDRRSSMFIASRTDHERRSHRGLLPRVERRRPGR